MSWTLGLWIWAMGCGVTPSEQAPAQDEGAEATKAAKAAGGASKGAHKASARGSHGASARGASAKGASARGGSARAAPTEVAARSRKASGGGGPGPLGAMGDVVGTLTLTPGAGEGGPQTTVALHLDSSAGKQDVPLGDAPGTCTETNAQPEGEGALKTLWTVTCAGGEVGGVLSVAQANASLVVRRARTAPDGTPGPFKLAKRIPLVEGATVVKP